MSARSILAALALLTIGVRCQAQQVTTPEAPARRLSIGGGAGLSGNLHSADFVALPGVPNCCPEYTGGFGLGGYGALLAQMPLSELFRVGLRVGFLQQSATLRRTETTVFEGERGPIRGDIDHRIDASLSTLGLDLRAEYALAASLWASVGARIGMTMTSRFEQSETLGENVQGGTFENGARTRNQIEGEIPDASTVGAALLAGIGYELPLDVSGRLRAVPEATFAFALTPVSSAVDWSAHALQVGVTIAYELPAPAPSPPVAAAPAPRLEAGIEFRPLANGAAGESAGVIYASETTHRWHSPVVPAIFFDSGATVLTGRYRQLDRAATDRFTLDGFTSGDYLAHHRELLNVIGRRLRSDAGATLTLIGSIARDEPPTTARLRAESVRRYLVEQWGIESGRITIGTDADPLARANEASEDGRQENRRVSLRSNRPSIVAPVDARRAEQRFDPASIIVHPTIIAEAGVRSATVDILAGERLLERVEQGSPAWRTDEVVWEPAASDVDAGSAGIPVTARLHVTDRNGAETVASTERPLFLKRQTELHDGRRQVTDARERITYQLVAFELDSPEPGAVNMELLRELGASVRRDATITIRGYADRLGIEEHNVALAQRRAERVADALRSILPRTIPVALDASGGGIDTTTFDNDLPEGRMLTRGVSVIVEQQVVTE
jgi:outer membrane protein OmpA-like peptidoglycan-associated protein